MGFVETMISKGPTMCILPWMHIYTSAGGDVVPCCEAQESIMNAGNLRETWNGPKYKELRTALMRGEQHPACHVCWHNEANGIESNREINERDFWDDYANKIVAFEDGTVETAPMWIESKVSNFCNLKCKMGSTESSYKRTHDLDIIRKFSPEDNEFQHETRLLRPLELYEYLQNDPELWEDVDRLQFSGGEPIINEEHYTLLNSIPQHRRHKIQLRYASNLTYLQFKKHDLIELWRQFKQVQVKISIDGVHDVYNYIRTGAEFESVVSNIRTLYASPVNVSLGLGLTVQAFNCFQLPEFYDYFEGMGIDWFHIGAYMLQTPKYLNIGVYPEPYRSAIQNKLKADGRFDHIVNYLDKNDKIKLWNKKTVPYAQALENRYKDKHTFDELLSKYLDI